MHGGCGSAELLDRRKDPWPTMNRRSLNCVVVLVSTAVQIATMTAGWTNASGT